MKTLSTSLLLLLSLLGSNYCKATHVMGAEVGWECLGGDKYKVTVKVYRDCNGIKLSNTKINLRGNCTGITTTTQTMSTGRDITPVCANQCSRCSSGSCSFKYGIMEHELTTTIDVSSFKKNGCCEVTISWAQCCRSGAIVTGAANQNFYVEGKMNVCQTPCDNSPIFSSSPISISCLGRDVIIDAGAYDIDTVNGTIDSLVHSFSDPLTSAGSKTSWKSPYSSQKWICYVDFPYPHPKNRFPFGLHLDSVDGEVMFRPMCLTQTVFTMKVEEYRKGKKIGEISRDVQVIIIKCPNNSPPVISGANCSAATPNNFKVYACTGRPICFHICLWDKDTIDSITMEWNNGIPDGSFSITNTGIGNQKTGRFCWTPKQSDASKFPHRFVVRGKDNSCPSPGRVARTFEIYVRENKKISINTSFKNLTCGLFNLSASTSDSVSNTEWEWYLNDTILIGKTGDSLLSKIQYKFPNNGIYPVKIMTNRSGCLEAFYDSVVVSGLKPIKLPNIDDQVVCIDKRINIPFTATGGHGSLAYSWQSTKMVNNGSVTADTVDATFHNSSHYSTITYRVTDTLGCSESNSFSVQVKQLHTRSLTSDKTFCGGDTLGVDTLPLPTDTLFGGGKWTGTGVSGNIFSPKGLGTGSYIVSYLKYGSNYCAVDDVHVLIANNPVANAGFDRSACHTYSPIKLSGSPVGGTWTGPKNTISGSNEFRPKKANLGNNILTYYVADSNGCEDTDTLVIEMKNYRALVDVGQDTSVCGGDSLMALYGVPANGSWKGNFLVQQNGGTYFKPPTVQNNKDYTLVYMAKDSIGCEGSDTLKIEVQELPSVSAGSDISHCFVGPKDKITLSGTPSGGLWKGYQLFGTNNVVEITANDIGSYEYTYEASNAAGCKNSDKMTLTIREKPNVDAGIDDTLCLSSTISKPLIGKPAGGKWLGGNLSQNGGKYFAELSTTTLYKNMYEYEFTDNFGCTNSDEMNIYVGEETTTDFTPSVTSGNAPLKVDFTNKSTNGVNWYWNFGNGKNSTSFEPSTTYLGGGTFKVILLTVDGTGYCHSTDAESITVKGGVGISTIPEGLVSLYPSPANESFIVENETGKDLNFTLYNETGQVVLERNVGTSVRFDIQALPKGYYFYKMISTDGQFHQDKLIVE